MDYRQRMPTPAETIAIALRSCDVINWKKNCENCPYEYQAAKLKGETNETNI